MPGLTFAGGSQQIQIKLPETGTLGLLKDNQIAFTIKPIDGLQGQNVLVRIHVDGCLVGELSEGTPKGNFQCMSSGNYGVGEAEVSLKHDQPTVVSFGVVPMDNTGTSEVAVGIYQQGRLIHRTSGQFRVAA